MLKVVLASFLLSGAVVHPVAAKTKIDVDFCRRAGEWAEKETYKKLENNDRSLLDSVSEFNAEQKEYKDYFVVFAKGILNFDYGINKEIREVSPDLAKKIEKLGADTQRKQVSEFCVENLMD